MGVDLLGERWSLLIVREIITGASRFNEIHRGLPGLSRTLLSNRLRYLERTEIVVKTDSGYQLTQAGEDLLDVITAFGSWTVRWRFPRPKQGQADPYLLLWRMHAGLDYTRVPADRRITLHFEFTEPQVHGWIVIDRDESTVCFQDPHYDVDLHLTGKTSAWYEIWYGHRTFAAAKSTGAIRVGGPEHLVTALPTWFVLSPFAASVAAQPHPERAVI